MVKGYTIKEFCKEDRPREKLKKYGAFSLSDKEVLAILLRTGTKNKNVIELASSILEDVGGITKLRETTFNELPKPKGIGEERRFIFWQILSLHDAFIQLIYRI